MSDYRDIEFVIGPCRKLDVEIESDSLEIEIGIDQGSGGKLPPYEGEYVVTPKIESQTLETKNKSMTSDVEVLEIPYSEVSNPEGGLTINIAYEL